MSATVSFWRRSGGDQGNGGVGRGGGDGDSGGGSHGGHEGRIRGSGDGGGGEDEGMAVEEVMVEMMKVVTVE